MAYHPAEDQLFLREPQAAGALLLTRECCGATAGRCKPPRCSGGAMPLGPGPPPSAAGGGQTSTPGGPALVPVPAPGAVDGAGGLGGAPEGPAAGPTGCCSPAGSCLTW